MEFEKSLTASFTQIINNFRYYFELEMNDINLHSGQIFILISLWNKDLQTQIELAKNLDLSAPTVHKMVNSLVKGGFVGCYKCEKDNRMMRVKLTEKGIECQKVVEKKFESFEDDFFSSLTGTEKLIFLQICEKLKNNLSKKSLNSKT